ncbi:MAG: PAS domain S-box protein, partial [Deltaproteobacteria bacterium]|nr:PAS domain S-box protein [Deltaproteobacteria bacterium]
MTHAEVRPILLVEDNPADARLIQTVLTPHAAHYPLVHVERLSDALTRLSQQEFAAVLLDLSLPDSSGFDTIRPIQTQAPQIPIIVLTGLDDEGVATKAVQEGAQDYLVKGQMVASALLRTIRYAIERHRLRQELRASEKRARALFENASDAIVSLTTEGIVTEVNRGLETLLGWSRQELVGQYVRRILTPATALRIEERRSQLLSGEPPPTFSPLIEIEALRKDGTVVPLEIRDDVLSDARGRPVGIMVMARDITTRKELERRRAEFLELLSHDIKNPLSVLLGYAEYLQEEAQQHGVVKSVDVLPWIKRSGLTILSLVDNYLDLSRIEDQSPSLKREPVGINDLLLNIGQQYEGEARHRNIAFALSLQPKLPWVEGDPIAMDRILANVVYNALKFTPPAGKVTVSSSLRGAEVVITVADTGPGIAAEEIPLLFEKYRRATGSRRKEGMGLGLFIVKTLVERHSGRIEVESVV